MTHDGPVTESDVQPTGRPNARLRQTLWDMVRSMALVLAVVGVLLLVTWRPQPEAVKVIDVTPAVTLASMQAAFDVAVPSALADGWRPTSARWEPTEESRPEPVLHIGYVTPSDEYAQVSQSTADGARYLAEQTADGAQTGQTLVGGRPFQTWESDDRRSLVSTQDGVTLIVSGTASWEELSVLASSLQPVTAGS